MVNRLDLDAVIRQHPELEKLMREKGIVIVVEVQRISDALDQMIIELRKETADGLQNWVPPVEPITYGPQKNKKKGKKKRW